MSSAKTTRPAKLRLPRALAGTIAASLAVAVMIFGLLAVQMANGRDPGLAQDSAGSTAATGSAATTEAPATATATTASSSVTAATAPATAPTPAPVQTSSS